MNENLLRYLICMVDVYMVANWPLDEFAKKQLLNLRLALENIAIDNIKMLTTEQIEEAERNVKTSISLIKDGKTWLQVYNSSKPAFFPFY